LHAHDTCHPLLYQLKLQASKHSTSSKQGDGGALHGFGASGERAFEQWSKSLDQSLRLSFAEVEKMYVQSDY